MEMMTGDERRGLWMLKLSWTVMWEDATDIKVRNKILSGELLFQKLKKAENRKEKLKSFSWI